MMAHAFNNINQEAESGKSLSLSPTWSTSGVTGQSGLCREALSQKQITQKIFAYNFI